MLTWHGQGFSHLCTKENIGYHSMSALSPAFGPRAVTAPQRDVPTPCALCAVSFSYTQPEPVFLCDVSRHGCSGKYHWRCMCRRAIAGVHATCPACDRRLSESEMKELRSSTEGDVIGLEGRIGALETRMGAIEAKLDVVIRGLGLGQ